MRLVDDEAVEGSDDENVLVPSSQSMINEDSRPIKKRRLNYVRAELSAESSNDMDDYHLPTYSQDQSEAEPEERSKPKRLMHVPEYPAQQENTFVTQLDQQYSSPSRIRGPRWRKKSSTPSLQSPTPPPPVRFPGDMAPPMSDDEFDDDDLAFVEAFEIPEDRLPSQAVGSQPRPARQMPTSFRQTTLFGHVSSQKSTQSSQAKAHSWPLANRQEAKTHHELNEEALATWVYPTNLGKTRDYQFNIVSRGLYHNLLVALPTGLGKTFIAAIIMLNWFRWTKTSQIIFVAPTKPLVAQQVDACFNIAGIPRSQTTMLVGNVPPAIRKEEWISKRVFFMTPQTLINDLKNGICDPKRVVLLVIDEAHRAKGGYAYGEVVKFLRRFNNSFRVLALTATPGSTVESVQDVIDGLDISRVEIRTEESIDIREYVHTRNIDPIVLENTDEITTTLELFGNAVRPIMTKLTSQNAYWQRDPTGITQFGLMKAREDWSKTAGRNANQGIKGMVNSIFTLLMQLANPLELLKFHGIGVFYHKVKAFEDEVKKGKSNNAKAIVKDEHWKKMMNRLKAWVNNPDFEGHPKLSYLKEVVLNHFLDAGENANTRIMIFSHYRDSAEEITRILNRQPMIKAHVFVGQAASKNSEGMDQKKQQEIVDGFKKGKYNTLVATSIGEEGLDIGEVDLIVCYDASKSPIRLLQRMGRTGRKRAGNIVLLLMKGKEERDYEAANDNYAKMQQLISNGKSFNFHDDRSTRIVPREVVPVVDKRVVEIPLENTQVGKTSWLPEPAKKGRKMKRPAKKWNMPDGVETGFTFLGEGKKKVESARDRAAAKSTTPYAKLDKEVAILPPLEDTVLSPEEEMWLEQRYAQVAGNEPQIIYPPRLDLHPEKLKSLGKTRKAGHSITTKGLARAYRAMGDPDRDWTRPGKPKSFEDLESGASDSDVSVVEMAPPKAKKAVSKKLKEKQKRKNGLPSGDISQQDQDQDQDEYDDKDSFIDDSIFDQDPFQDRSGDEGLPNLDKVTAKSPQPQTFYLSQNIVGDDDDHDDLEQMLPDFDGLMSARKEGSPPMRNLGDKDDGGGRKRKAKRVVDSDDDDD